MTKPAPQLRPYQKTAVEFATSKLIDRGNSLLVCATGGGKTAMLAKVAEFLIQNAGCKLIYVIVGIDKVNQQNKETIRRFAPGIPTSEYSGRLKSLHGKIVCMMQQTANNHYMHLPRPDAVLIDETHHAMAETYIRVLKYWNPKFLFGATATPDRGDKQSLITLFDNYHQISSRELIEMNFLCSPEFHPFMCNTDSDLAISAAMDELPLQPGKTIHFCRNHEYASNLVRILSDLGHKVAYLGDNRDNDAEYAMFDEEDCEHLVNVNIATEGYDEPRIMNVMNWCSDGSRGRMIQKYGRGLRPLITKKLCRIFDCGGNIEKYGDLEYTEILPKQLVKEKGESLRIEDLFKDPTDATGSQSGPMPELPVFAEGNKTMPYSAPDGWFSFYDIDCGTTFLRNDGALARFIDRATNMEREVAIKQDDLFDFEEIIIPGGRTCGKTQKQAEILNQWQLRRLADVPTFGFSPQQADAVLGFKEWKQKEKQCPRCGEYNKSIFLSVCKDCDHEMREEAAEDDRRSGDMMDAYMDDGSGFTKY